MFYETVFPLIIGSETDEQKLASAGEMAVGISALVEEMTNSFNLPFRDVEGSLIFAFDHCFPIKGQGTILTGTVLKGRVKVRNSMTLI